MFFVYFSCSLYLYPYWPFKVILVGIYKSSFKCRTIVFAIVCYLLLFGSHTRKPIKYRDEYLAKRNSNKNIKIIVYRQDGTGLL